MSDHLPPLFVIQTRQKEDFLFLSVATLLGAGGTLPTGIFQSDGYSVINILGISDQPFRIRIEEAPTKDGPFVQTGLLTSALDAATGLQKIANRYVPTGAFMRAFVDNLGGPQTIFQVVFAGLPLAGAGTGAVPPGGGVTEIIGSPGILVNGTTGVPQSGSVTLTLDPEDLVDVFQARLFTELNGVSSTLTLLPYKGNEILVNDELVVVPDAGMTRLVTDNMIDAAGAVSGVPAPDTLYYVYVSNSQAVFSPLSIRLSATPWTTVEGVKYLGAAGNARNWRFVGWVRPNATPQFESSESGRLIINYYNRIALQMFVNSGYVDNNANTTYSTSSVTWATLQSITGMGPSQMRFISNGEDAVDYDATYILNGQSIALVGIVGIGEDSQTQAIAGALCQPTAGTSNDSVPVEKATFFPEGFHTLDMLICISGAGPLTFYADIGRPGGDAVDVRGTLMSAMVYG